MNIDHLLQIPSIVLKVSEKQRIFTWNIHYLIAFAYTAGYELTFGEAFRTVEQAALNASSGAGIVNSLHIKRLAVDFNLFKNGEWLQNSADHQPLGIYWKTLHELNRWGGDFKKADGNHYSMEHEGVK